MAIQSIHISIHALLTESDRSALLNTQRHSPFLSTLSLRRATLAYSRLLAWSAYFYPRSPYGERRHRHAHNLANFSISIHALLTESDEQSASYNAYLEDFYPRSPYGERHDLEPSSTRKLTFLSTLSLRRATSDVSERESLAEDFYPRSPYGERRVTVLGIQHRVGISIHALLTESDGNEPNFPRKAKPYFYPRSPYGERRHPKMPDHPHNTNFYPRSPYGERLENPLRQVVNRRISIHALLTESDARNTSIAGLITSFLSTLSLRRATSL